MIRLFLLEISTVTLQSLQLLKLRTMATSPWIDGLYSYVYSGQWGKLDHIFINEEAYLKLDGAAFTLRHCYADEPHYIDYNSN